MHHKLIGCLTDRDASKFFERNRSLGRFSFEADEVFAGNEYDPFLFASRVVELEYFFRKQYLFCVLKEMFLGLIGVPFGWRIFKTSLQLCKFIESNWLPFGVDCILSQDSKGQKLNRSGKIK